MDCDKFIFGGKSDHITNWKACYRGALAFGGDRRFLLSDSGHMQTMLNAPDKRGARYYHGDTLPREADEWLESAELEEGSWWPCWSDWVLSRSLAMKNAPAALGNRRFPAGAPAPGHYVHQASTRRSTGVDHG